MDTPLQSEASLSHKTHTTQPPLRKTLSSRSLAATICQQVIEQGKSLDDALSQLPTSIAKPDRAFIQKLSFGVIRWFWQLEKDSQAFLKKPPRKKDSIVRFIILLGIYQIKRTDIPKHAAVSATVKCCDELGKKWAKGLVNACLRAYLRSQDNLPMAHQASANDCDFSHPQWLASAIHSAWPEQAKTILAANNQQAPFCLRVNPQKISRDDYLKQLKQQQISAAQDPYSPYGIRLSHSLPISELPHFDQAWTSVQDTASQLIATFFRPQSNERVLDACAAPGGKTTLLLEQSDPTVAIDALDIGGTRNQKLLSTLERFGDHQTIRVLEGDASKPQTWWDNQLYDRILLDAPCSGLGVIRRHPDIKHLRCADDIVQLKKQQQSILRACWELLKPGGELLYTTCSILPEENVEQIREFAQHAPVQTEFTHLSIDHPNAIPQEYGVQTLPGVSDMDGFYYCHLRKAVQ